MKWKISVDSSYDQIYGNLSSDDIKVQIIPFVINVNNKEYIDDENIDLKDMLSQADKTSEPCKSACASSYTWYESFLQAENNIAITISSNLSGNYQSALIGKQMLQEEEPNKKVIVINSCSASCELSLAVNYAIKLIHQGLSIEEIENKLNEFFLNTHVVFSLCSFDNLMKNGRMNKAIGLLAKSLKMWAIGVGSNDGVIEIKAKVRSQSKVIETIIIDMQEHNFDNGTIAISHCFNEELADKIKQAILEKWPDSNIQIGLTSGLCSIYTDKSGVVVSYY